jgi:hypothetical protein
VQGERRVKTVTELVEVPSFELCRAAAKDIQVPSIDYAEREQLHEMRSIE